MAQVKKGSRLALPKGFTTVGGFGDSWKPTKKGESIMGTLLAVKKVKNKTAKKGEDPNYHIATIRQADGSEVQVFKSSRLAPLFAQKKGTKVYARFDGIGKATKKGYSAPRLFTVAVGK